MNRLVNITFYLVFIISSGQLLADSKIQWQLDSSPGFVSEVQELVSSKNLKIREKTGIRQLLFDVDIILTDETVTKRVRKVWYFPDSNALQNYGTEVIYYDELSEKIKIKEASTLNPDGELIQFNSANMQVIDSDTYDVFSNTKKLLIPYQNLKIGGYALLDYEIEVDKQKLEADWSGIFYPQSSYPRDEFRLSIKFSPANRINWSSTTDTIECYKDKSRLTCTARDISPIKSDFSVAWLDELDQIIVSESKSWGSVVDKAMIAFDSSKLEVNGSAEKLFELIKSRQHLDDKIAAIHSFVARDIRYISVSKNGHAITPHTISETLKNRYGDCKDKSAVLVELLNQVGINAYPVLVATERYNLERLKIPAMIYFDHMIVCFSLNGTKKCLDATDSHTTWTTTSAWIQGKVILEMVKNSTPDTIPLNQYRWDMEFKTDIVFLENGGMSEKQTRTYLSEYAGSLRRLLSEKSQEEITRWAVDQFQAIISSKYEPVFEFSGLKNMDESLEIISSIDYDPFIDVNDDLFYYEYDYWLQDEIDSLYIKNKHYGSSFAGLKIISEYQIDVSSLWKLKGSIPKLHLQHKYGLLDRSIIKRNDDKVQIITKLEIPSRKLSVNESESFNKFLKLIKRESKVRIYGNRNQKIKS